MRDADDALEKWEQAQEIAAALQSCAGWSLDQDVRSVKDSVRVFRGNHRELDLAMRIVDDPGRWLPLASVDNREGHAAYIDELDRLLHNYLASAYSLSSCMFKITERRKWDSLPVRGEYRSRNPFVRAGPSAFMFGLRHVAQHQRIPLTTSGSRGWRDEASGQLVSEDYFLVILDVVRTLDWSRDPRGNAYLETLIEDPRLDDLVPAFTSALLQFADWFTDRFPRIYHQEFEELESLHVQHSALMQPFISQRVPGHRCCPQ